MDSITDGFAAFDKDWRYIYINDHHAFPDDKTAKEILGKNVWEVFPNAVDTFLYEQFHRARKKGFLSILKHLPIMMIHGLK